MRQTDHVKRDEDKTGPFAVLQVQHLGLERLEHFVSRRFSSAPPAQRNAERWSDLDFRPPGQSGAAGRFSCPGGQQHPEPKRGGQREE